MTYQDLAIFFLLRGVAVPCVLAVALVTAARLWVPSHFLKAAVACAFCLAGVAGYSLVVEPPLFPPRGAGPYSFFLTITTAAVAALSCVLPVSMQGRARLVVAVVATAAALWFVVAPGLRGFEADAARAAWITCAVSGAALCALLPVARIGRGALYPACALWGFVAALGNLSLALALSGTISVAQLAGIVAAAAGGVALVAAIWPNHAPADGLLLPLGIAHLSFAAVGTLFSSLNPAHAFPLLAAPLAPAVLCFAISPRISGGPCRARWLMGLSWLASFLVSFIGVWLAWQEYQLNPL